MKTRIAIIAITGVVGSLAAVAYYRSGLLNLPGVPEDVSASRAGLDGLDAMRIRDGEVRGPGGGGGLAPDTGVGPGNAAALIGRLEAAVRKDPADIVLSNALRMELFRLKREWLARNAANSEIALNFPEELRDQPVRFFRALAAERPIREVRLQLALALVDHMLLFPALEIRAPASVEAVEVLSAVLDDPLGEPYYVPALYARGLNYLYRPFNLVWPEKMAAPPDAASKDLALCVAVGQKIGAGSDALKAELALSLGDAYAKEGKLSLARSWWQIANNMARNEAFRGRVYIRLRWNDEEVAASLEGALQERMADLDHPLGDLRFMWE